jgi:hypothetical protein
MIKMKGEKTEKILSTMKNTSVQNKMGLSKPYYFSIYKKGDKSRSMEEKPMGCEYFGKKEKIIEIKKKEKKKSR